VNFWNRICAAGLVMLAIVGTAEAMTSKVIVKATRNGPNTTFTVQVCVCLSGLEVIAFNAAPGAKSVTLNLTKPICITENDTFDDDELNLCQPAGVITEPFTWHYGYGCPPSPPVCVTVATLGPIASSTYGNENPAEFQLGESGQEEGTVPSGTTVTVTTAGPSTPSMPNHNS